MQISTDVRQWNRIQKVRSMILKAYQKPKHFTAVYNTEIRFSNKIKPSPGSVFCWITIAASPCILVSCYACNHDDKVRNAIIALSRSSLMMVSIAFLCVLLSDFDRQVSTTCQQMDRMWCNLVALRVREGDRLSPSGLEVDDWLSNDWKCCFLCNITSANWAFPCINMAISLPGNK